MKISILDDYQDTLRGLDCFHRLDGHEVTVWNDHVDVLEEQARRLKDTEALVLIRERSQVSGALLDRLPNLKLINNIGSRQHIDMGACTRLGIVVSTPPRPEGAFGNTAELTWGLVLAAMRRIPQQVTALRAGEWLPGVGRTLRGNTLGVYSYGRLGALVAGYGRAFGMRVIVLARPDTAERARADGFEVADDREEFFSMCDVISLHLRLVDATRGIVTAEDMARMKPDSLMVNTSRAELIEPGALVTALKAGRPGMAALDVFDEEPFCDPEHPLLNMPNVICTPHIGYLTVEEFEVLFADVFAQINAFADGSPQNVVNPEVLNLTPPNDDN